jgi:hypothetical protein
MFFARTPQQLPLAQEEDLMRRRSPVFACLAILFIGCSSEPYQVAPVSGRVTVDGKPVEKAAVMFQPVAPKGNINPGPGSYGITDTDGRYTLKLIGLERPGAAVGLHKVRIENYTDPGDPSDDRPRKIVKPAIPIPSRYNRIDALLEFEVRPGASNEANFDLTTKEPPRTAGGRK